MSWPCAALAHASLADRTTMRVGGAAEWLLEPASPEELARAVKAAREKGCEPRILGGGANLIVADGLLPGVVISTARLSRAFRPGAEAIAPDAGEARVAPPPRPAEARPAEARPGDARLAAWCGATMPRIVSICQRLGWAGFEGLAGVPGNLGGGIAMNAGGRGCEVWDVVEEVLLVDAQGDLVRRARPECGPRYRDGGLGGTIVASAVLRFRPDDPAAVAERCREHLRAKKAAQPLTERSAGCVFKNPDPAASGGRSAARLVEECGGKGLARGDAVVSPLHGNFIVNRGSASAADVLGLIEDLRDLVLSRAGIGLQREVVVWSP